jgi:signal transduction histidine kinase
MAVDTRYQVSLFEGASEGEMEWLIANSRLLHLNSGDYFIKEGDADVKFAVILEGELQVTRQLHGAVTVVGTTPRGITCGQLNLLNGTPAEQTIRAIMPSTLMVFEPDAFRAIFSVSPSVGSSILRIAAQRMAMFVSQETQNQKMAALGKLSAGLAHELNNPAAAARRASQSLREALPALQLETIALNICHFSPEQTITLMNLQQSLVTRLANPPILSPLARGDREEAVGSWLDEHQVGSAWEIAPLLVNAGFTLDELSALSAKVGESFTPQVLSWLSHILTVTELLDVADHSTRRISDLVSAIKEYTYMDRARTTENVDLHRGLDTTLTVLNHKLNRINVVRDYDATLSTVVGNGGDLNQVWTNLIDNASDAMKGGGTLRIITRNENAFAMIEIADSGIGIPPEVLPHIFAPFFTTKGVGAGTGLGLDISYRIIQQHNATIEVQSQPGNTRFIVRLPVIAQR